MQWKQYEALVNCLKLGIHDFTHEWGEWGRISALSGIVCQAVYRGEQGRIQSNPLLLTGLRRPTKISKYLILVARRQALAQLKQSPEAIPQDHCLFCSLRLRKVAKRASESAMATQRVLWTENMEVGRAVATA